MDAGNIKRQALYLGIVALGCVLAWNIAPRLSTSAFVNRVSPAANIATNATPGPHAPPGSVLVNISMVGFDPAVIPAKAGQPIKLAFYRPNAANCAREVVFPDLGIRKDLPPGETTVVELTPPKSGSLGFACGMNMLKGKLIVR
jgi:hypothetical protein